MVLVEGVALMCGVCGEIRFKDGPVFDSGMMQRFREPLSHRGPDSTGMYASPDGRAGLGFPRLRIDDLSSNCLLYTSPRPRD